MMPAMRTLAAFFLFIHAAPALSADAPAPSPRKALASAVEKVKAKPDDDALRQKAIALALTLKPAPEIPEEAERRMARGRVAFDAADYREAIKEYQQAALAAPWHGEAYHKLGVAQDKSGDLEGALRSLKLAHQATRRRDIKALIYEVEYRFEKWNAPEARSAREYKARSDREAAEARARAENEERARRNFLHSFDGNVYDCGTSQDYYGYVTYKSKIEIKDGKVDGTKEVTWFQPGKASPSEVVGFRPLWFFPNDFPIEGTSTTAREGTAVTTVQIYNDRVEWETSRGEYQNQKVTDSGVCRR